ncbi:hypothetical protein WSK_2434 [Novosphingobium sp. Rr 2-17]|uniref:DUF1810 domain-containing protein n=1 Tax=Novosphingobium sp. Rr 2-17 TaxID=555793 RepID=UPI000269A82E|nr:DUF1810 domain-containing protein [Novosphingobium sp. Rr 2-17]EIZ78891.1 hypothetical protein WSK_2434 [Novosphingobium sp. Rr 2-17]
MSGLDRFVVAQRDVYPQVLAELADGAKRTHWMWFVFPQIEGLGRSPTAQHFALAGLGEASAYLNHSLLADRLRECTALMLGWSGRRNAEAILGAVDAMKLRSSMTVFERAGAARGEGLFAQVLDAFFDGSRDEVTLRLLAR